MCYNQKFNQANVWQLKADFFFSWPCRTRVPSTLPAQSFVREVPLTTGRTPCTRQSQRRTARTGWIDGCYFRKPTWNRYCGDSDIQMPFDCWSSIQTFFLQNCPENWLLVQYLDRFWFMDYSGIQNPDYKWSNDAKWYHFWMPFVNQAFMASFWRVDHWWDTKLSGF